MSFKNQWGIEEKWNTDYTADTPVTSNAAAKFANVQDSNADNLFGSQKRKLKATAAAIDTLSKNQHMSEANILAATLQSDGRISKRDKKLIKQNKRLTEQTAKVEARQEGRSNRVTDRQQGMTDRVQARTDRVTARQDAKVQTAEAKQQQVAAIEPGLSSPLSGGGGGDMSGMENLQTATREAREDQSTGDPVEQTTSKQTIFKYVLIAALAVAAIYFLPKLLKKK